jgi:catechol 2,3-dioxygenase-like lactoylglutathione lyase family enzyme
MTTAVALDHFVLVVADVERALAWYQRHLELTPVRLDEWRNGTAPFPSLRVTGDTIIDFIPAVGPGGGGTVPPQRATSDRATSDRATSDRAASEHLDHICFVVSATDLEELRGRAELAIEAEGDRFGARGVAHSIYVRDPDDLLVEVRAYPS